MKKTHLKSLLIAAALLLVVVVIIASPKIILAASIRGLNIWWGIVFPSLLPFLILSELMISFGVVALIGTLCEPFMRPLFKVPGVGGFVLALGMVSGFPTGAKMTAQLRNERLLSRTEAERLAAFTNTANPLFIFGAVAVGFFHEPELGLMIAFAHYGANLIVGFLMRFYRKNEISVKPSLKKGAIRTAILAMHRTRISEKRPFGKVFGDAISSSVQTLLMIGGFIIAFSVLNKVLFQIGVIPFLAHLVSQLVLPTLSSPLIAGFFEITLGIQLTSSTNAPVLFAMMAVAFILGFGGLSVHAQVASIFATSDIRYRPFLLAKIAHAVIAVILTVGLFKHAEWITDVYRPLVFPTVDNFIMPLGPLLTLATLGLYSLIYFFRQLGKND